MDYILNRKKWPFTRTGISSSKTDCKRYKTERVYVLKIIKETRVIKDQPENLL